jgi:hypothetical protein
VHGPRFRVAMSAGRRDRLHDIDARPSRRIWLAHHGAMQPRPRRSWRQVRAGLRASLRARHRDSALDARGPLSAFAAQRLSEVPALRFAPGGAYVRHTANTGCQAGLTSSSIAEL